MSRDRPPCGQNTLHTYIFHCKLTIIYIYLLVTGIFGYPIWSKTKMELIFNPCCEFRWSSEGPVSQNHTSHLYVARWCPWDLFRSIKICLDANESRVRKATGSYRTYSVPGITAVLVSGFAVEDLPSSRTAAKVPALRVKHLPLGRTL